MSNHLNPRDNQSGLTHGVPIDMDLRSDFGEPLFESDESDGGMQLDYYDSAPEEDVDPPVQVNHPGPIPQQSQDQNFSTQAPDPRVYLQEQRGSLDEESDNPALSSKQHQNPMSEEEHAALTVLLDDELLMTYALNSGTTIPQTRRRFQAKLCAKGDPVLEEELYAGRFIIPEDKAKYVPELINHPLTTTAVGLNGSKAYLVPAKWSERVDDFEGDVSSWIAPGSKHVKIRYPKKRVDPLQGNSKPGPK